MNNLKKVWIAWEQQRRSIILSEEFECQLFLYTREHQNLLARYARASLATVAYVRRSRPDIVFCQNPSMILAVLLSILKPIFRYKLIVDRHSNFMFNNSRKFRKTLFMGLSAFTVKAADLTIVTNERLKNKYIEQFGGLCKVLPDKIPDMSTGVQLPEKKRDLKNIFFITSFSPDEPIEEFFEAIQDLPSHYYFYVSGNYRKHTRELDPYGKNYVLTGFVDEYDYKKTLNSADAVMVFTKNDYTLTCGAYEGLGGNKPKPLILSNTTAIKEYFSAGAVYCDMIPESIRSGILRCFQNYELLEKEAWNLKNRLNYLWSQRFFEICNFVNAL